MNFTVTGVIESLDLLNNLNHKHSICMFCSIWYLDTLLKYIHLDVSILSGDPACLFGTMGCSILCLGGLTKKIFNKES